MIAKVKMIENFGPISHRFEDPKTGV